MDGGGRWAALRTAVVVSSWLNDVVGELEASGNSLVVAADPDGLLLEERMLQCIDVLGFELITFDDPVAFRFVFESRYWLPREKGVGDGEGLLVRVSTSDTDALPHDLLATGHRLSFGLSDLFQDLSEPVVASLDRGDLDALFTAQRVDPPSQRLGDRKTRDYVLRHVFGVAPETIAREEDLLRFLLRRHYRVLRIPGALDAHLTDSLAQRSRFRDWPLARIIPDREAFFAFLQGALAALPRPPGGTVHRPRGTARPRGTRSQIAGPIRVAFDHEDVRIYIDSLFLEGVLKPVPHRNAERLAGSWVMVGVSTDPAADRARRVHGLLATAEETVPGEAAGHRDWLAFARRWAELRALKDDLSEPEADIGVNERVDVLRNRIDKSFAVWLAAHYRALHNHPPVPPVMLHHYPSGPRSSRRPGTRPEDRPGDDRRPGAGPVGGGSGGACRAAAGSTLSRERRLRLDPDAYLRVTASLLRRASAALLLFDHIEHGR